MRVIEDILLSERDGGVRTRAMAVCRVLREASISRVVKWLKGKYRFQ